MYENGRIYMGLAGDKRGEMALNMCNRHGLIAGASGTGKTVTMKVMAESFSDAGVPVFLCDVKGDVAGICAPGQPSEGMEKRIDRFGLRGSFTYRGYPTTFWDIYQQGGHAVRATVSDMGPELLSRILGLTAAQEGILHIVFRIADDKGLLLIDLKDLRAMLTYVNEHRTEYMMTYGNITSQSVAAILRALLPLEQQGGDLFFGEPALDIHDWMRMAADGRGMINVLDCVKLVQNPTLYASFLLWMLSELFEILPEAPYTAADLDWKDKTSRSTLEMKDAASRPAISGRVENMAQYDTVFVGFPIWWYQAPRIIETFLERYDFAGKTLIPFATSGGSDMDKTEDILRPCCSAQTAWCPGKRLSSRESAASVREWVESLHC